MRSTLLNPPATAITQWPATDDLPLGVPREHLQSRTQHLRLAGLTFTTEYARAIRHPHLYDARDLEHMHEMHLAANGLTEWDCGRCGQWNLTPDAEWITGANPCAYCAPVDHTDERVIHILTTLLGPITLQES